MSATGNNLIWISVCLASILICFRIEALPVTANANATPLDSSNPADTLTNSFNIDDAISLVSESRNIVVRSADSDDNSVDDDSSEKNDKTEKPHSDKSEEIFPSDNKHHSNPHPHGSHGTLGPIKSILDHLGTNGQDGHPSRLGGLLGGVLGGPRRQNSEHESPIETEKDRTMINSSTGLHVLEFLGTLFGLVWGFLSNIPALFGSSSSGLSGGQ